MSYRIVDVSADVEPVLSVAWSAVICIDGVCSECGKPDDDEHPARCCTRATASAAPLVTLDGAPVSDPERQTIRAMLANAASLDDIRAAIEADIARIERHVSASAPA